MALSEYSVRTVVHVVHRAASPIYPPVRPHADPPHIRLGNMTQTAREGESLTVSVPVRANPPVDSFEWFRLPPAPHLLFELRVGEQHLSILTQRGAHQSFGPLSTELTPYNTVLNCTVLVEL